MSLLLDALKRAEQERLARQGEASNDGATAPESAAATPPDGGRTGAALELQPLASATSNAPARADDAHAAQMMFDAKTPGEAKRNRGMLFATLGAIAVVVASAAAYVWYQIRVLSPPAVPVATRRPPPPPLQMAAGAPPPATPLAEPARASSSTSTESPRSPDASRAPAAVTVTEPPANGSARASTPPATEDPVTRLLRETPAATPAPPLKLARTIETPRIPPEVSAGYTALQADDLAAARRHYAAALEKDPSGVDARLGMATVEARAGNRSLAMLHYRRVLESDPRNATALAGLAAMADATSPEAVEAQLREDVARYPESAALQFTLGSHYAGRGRWGEAQAAFFEAHRLDPANADILYNLAVSLDHMNQPRLAADFYRRAVEASQAQPAQFDPAPVRRRIAELSGSR